MMCVMEKRGSYPGGNRGTAQVLTLGKALKLSLRPVRTLAHQPQRHRLNSVTDLSRSRPVEERAPALRARGYGVHRLNQQDHAEHRRMAKGNERWDGCWSRTMARPAISLADKPTHSRKRNRSSKHNGARGLMQPASPKNSECPICRGAGWVCEAHPTRPWGIEAAAIVRGQECRARAIRAAALTIRRTCPPAR
jgi:hypothetical protein